MLESNEGQTGPFRFLNFHNVGMVLFIVLGMVMIFVFADTEDIDGTVQWRSSSGDLWEGEPGDCHNFGRAMFGELGENHDMTLHISEHDAWLTGGDIDYRFEPSQCVIDTWRRDTGDGDGELRGRCSVDEFQVSWDLSYEFCGQSVD